MDIKTIRASDRYIELIKSYKLETLKDFIENKEELEKIESYIDDNLPKQIKEYRLITKDDKIIGCFLLTKKETEFLLDEIFIEKEYRNKKIGSNIIKDIIKNRHVVLWVYKKNQKAIDLYKKLGFKIKEEDEKRYMMSYHKTNKWTKYQKNTYGNSVDNLLLEFLENHSIQDAIDLGCGSGNETVYMIKKGINVLAIDKELNENYFKDRLTQDEQKNLTLMQSSFEEVELPPKDAIFAFFSIPFCSPNHFDRLWKKIYDSLKPGGYFVGQLFGDRDDWKDIKSICTFSKDKIDEYLKLYDVLKLEEIEYTRDTDLKHWHFYNIIYRK